MLIRSDILCIIIDPGRETPFIHSRFKELRDNQDDGRHFMPERIKAVG